MEVKKTSVKNQVSIIQKSGYLLFFLWAGFVLVKYIIVLLERGRIRSIWPLS